MTKIIHVVGKSNTGKTSSIKKFSSDVQLNGTANIRLRRPKMRVEICEVLDYFVGSMVYRVGVASTGDRLPQIQQNFSFFDSFEVENNCKLDFVVCASHTVGYGYDYILSRVKAQDERVPIQTVKEINISQFQVQIDRVADLIFANIP